MALTSEPQRLETIRERLEWFMRNMLSDSDIPKMYHPIILNLAKGYFERTKDEDTRRILNEIRKEVIPWLINGEPPNQNPQ